MSSFTNLFFIACIKCVFVLAKKTTSTTSTTLTSTSPSDNIKPVLSELWTEGLIICLFVSLLLMAIVVIAIKATSSITISYGALEDKTQNQDSSKKIQ
ncbi:unnamed protein product [Hanseniaspora opuntiae]